MDNNNHNDYITKLLSTLQSNWKTALLGATGSAAIVGVISFLYSQQKSSPHQQQQQQSTTVEIAVHPKDETAQLREIINKHKLSHPEQYRLRERDDSILKVITFRREPVSQNWKLEVVIVIIIIIVIYCCSYIMN